MLPPANGESEDARKARRDMHRGLEEAAVRARDGAAAHAYHAKLAQ